MNRDVEILARHYRGEKMSKIARDLGLTPQAVSAMVRRAEYGAGHKGERVLDAAGMRLDYDALNTKREQRNFELGR